MPKAIELTEKRIQEIETPERGFITVRDSVEPGLAVRSYCGGLKTFVVIVTVARRKRTFRLGPTKGWQVAYARKQARSLRERIKEQNHDPVKDKKDKAAATAKEMAEGRCVNDLIAEFEKIYVPRLRPKTQEDYLRVLRTDVAPSLGKKKIKAVTTADIEQQLGVIKARAPKSGNLFLAVVSKLFNWGLKSKKDENGQGWAATNPAQGMPRDNLDAGVKPLTPDQRTALNKALDEYEDQDIADYFRLLLLSGARSGETKCAEWTAMLDGMTVWQKPSSQTKQKTIHEAPLSAPATALLKKRWKQREAELKRVAREIEKTNDPDRIAELEEHAHNTDIYVFPAKRKDSKHGHMMSAKKGWHQIATAAGFTKKVRVKGKLVTKHTVRVHDLRHLAASILVSENVSLYIVSKVLGHSSLSTTEKYAKVSEAAKRAAVDLLGEKLAAPAKVAAE